MKAFKLIYMYEVCTMYTYLARTVCMLIDLLIDLKVQRSPMVDSFINVQEGIIVLNASRKQCADEC